MEHFTWLLHVKVHGITVRVNNSRGFIVQGDMRDVLSHNSSLSM